MWKISFDMKAVQDNVNRILNKKIAVTEYTEVKDEIAGEYAKAISRYVPYKTGKLMKSADVEDGAVTYSVEVNRPNRPNGKFDYAKVQYYTPFENRSTPNTYDHWNKHLTTAERQEFYEDVKDIIVERMNHE